MRNHTIVGNRVSLINDNFELQLSKYLNTFLIRIDQPKLYFAVYLLIQNLTI